MQQPTTKQLYAYWDRVRNGRVAPRRFEIEPAKIAPLLPETFIAEGAGRPACRFRLAGTKICEQFGRALRGADILSLWGTPDRESLSTLVRNVFSDAAVGYGRFRGRTGSNREAHFEFLLLPLFHGGEALSILGSISAIDPPFWLGSEPLDRQEILELNLHWPDGVPAFMATVISLARHRFRLLAGGLGESSPSSNKDAH